MKILTYKKKLFLLFSTFAKITALVVGGGLAMLPVIEEVFVNKYKMISKEEMLDMVTLAQTIPGIIMANSAVYIGMKVARTAGAIVALLGAVTPPFFVILLIAIFFPSMNPENKYLLGAFSGVRACITGLIAVTGINMFKQIIKGWYEFVLFIVALCLVLVFEVSPAFVILGAMPFGLLYVWFSQKKFCMQEGDIQE